MSCSCFLNLSCPYKSLCWSFFLQCLCILSSSEFTCCLANVLTSVLFSQTQDSTTPKEILQLKPRRGMFTVYFSPVQKSMKNIACARAYIETIHYAFSFYYIYRFPLFQMMQILYRSD